MDNVDGIGSLGADVEYDPRDFEDDFEDRGRYEMPLDVEERIAKEENERQEARERSGSLKW
jgi:hypothetical protein